MKIFIMESLQEQISQICRLADNTISNPEISPIKAAQSIGLSSSVVTFVGGTGLLAAPLSLSLSSLFPFGVALYYLWKTYSDAKKKQLEKERMLREVIAKQQAVIRKLEEEIRRSARQNARNKAEIENLKEMLRILKSTEKQLNKAA